MKRLSVLLLAVVGLAVSTPAPAWAANSRHLGTELVEMNGAQSGGSFGDAVAVSGNTVVIGAQYSGNDLVAGPAYQDGSPGAAEVFERTDLGWKWTAELRPVGPISPWERFGSAVAVSGTSIAVGDPGYDNGIGCVYIFEQTTHGWVHTDTLFAAGGQQEGVGQSVAISGNTLVTGDEYHDGTGAAYVFTKAGGNWYQTAELQPADIANGDSFGQAVAISGSTIVVGAQGKWNGAGAAYVFSRGRADGAR